MYQALGEPSLPLALHDEGDGRPYPLHRYPVHTTMVLRAVRVRITDCDHRRSSSATVSATVAPRDSVFSSARLNR
ncbi:hypothetical protein GCM10022226_19290 [Sphaerisporangium flaviroseum]|uniref:Uncharacterized protein n=1 Tax=Sphaerisporangium flaviroseum TaxID=509199 RepID=A0ABP7HRY4_9ACTN